MTVSQPQRQRKRFIRLSLITFGTIALLILGLHIWFVNNARRMIKDMVATESKGKLRLELSQISYNFFTNNLQVKEVSLASTDSTTEPVSYRITFQKLSLQVGSFWPLLFRKKADIDSIFLTEPDIVVTQWRKDTTASKEKNELSIAQEMGTIYNSMLDGLESFGIQRIVIRNARLSLVNKIKPQSLPVVISNINFNLVRSKNAGENDEFIHDQQTVDLNTKNQDISLPGGRHRLAFKNFNLQLFNKRIELDSCTITAIATDSLKSSYTIFFKKLLLVGVDFSAMYHNNLIKADSVYCENPLFEISINTLAKSTGKKGKPDPEKIIQEMTGDLDLAFVGVKDAGIHINITGNKNRSLFNSNKDDFEMYGLRINADSSQPVVVKRFDMHVRDYRLYNEDSSTAYTLDSIHFLNNKIVLNNFGIVTTSKPSKIQSERSFSFPYFELTGLDWYQVIFEENLMAEEAVLYNPVIKYERRKATTGKKPNIFRSLQTLDGLITLDKLSILNGQIDLVLGNSTSLKMKDVYLNLLSNKLLKSSNNEGIRESVERFSFTNAVFRFRDITAEISDATYTGRELVHADKIFVTSKSANTRISANDVFVGNFMIDEKSETMVVDGLRWRNADIQLRQGPIKKNTKASNISLSNIAGRNMQFNFSNGTNTINAYVNALKVTEFRKNSKGITQVYGFNIDGRDLSINGESLHVKAASYAISNDHPSWLTSVQFEQLKEKDTLTLHSPRIDFTADINSILANDIYLQNLEMTAPVVKYIKGNETRMKEVHMPVIRVDNFSATEPDMHFVFHKNDSTTLINFPKSEGGKLQGSGLVVDQKGVQVSNLSVKTNSATLVKRNGEVVGVENGRADLDLSNLEFSKDSTGSKWTALVNTLHLKNPNKFLLGNTGNHLQFDETSIGNLNISSGNIRDLNTLLRTNLSAWIRSTTGHYIDSVNTFKWYNAEYNSSKRTLQLDSFTYIPTQPRDSVIANSHYQTDYITLSTGAIKLNGFNLDQYEKDNSFHADTLELVQPLFTIYRDKAPPFLSGIEKPLPVDMIARIPFPVSMEKIIVNDGSLAYTEKHPKTRAEGTVLLTHMDAEISNIKNRSISPGDSLLLTMSAYLMDSSQLHLMVKESYLDSLSGFLMTLKLRPTTLSFLNPVIMPLSNVEIVSGTVDSFQLRAIGHDNLSIGEMEMFYHDLRIRIIKNGEEKRSSIMGDLASFLVNAFVIRKNNKGRTGIVYFERIKDRSFFHYIVKMTFSGMITSIGVKKNKKFLRQYKRELKERNLPPIEFN